MNSPLPTFDMMTGQQLETQPSAPMQTAIMAAHDSNVVLVQLLDRMVVVPSAIVNGPTLRHFVTCPSGQTPMGQQGQAYLLFVTWKNFRPLLEYWSGDAVKLPSVKAELLELKQTARKFNAKEFERLVNRHMKRLYGGGCMGRSCFGMSSPQATAYQNPPKAQAQPAAKAQTQLASENNPALSPQAQQHSMMQPARQKLAPIRTKPVARRSLFSRVRPARHTRAEKAYNTKDNGLYVDANTQEQPQLVYDLQRPLIV